jgi:hypothetical protein
LRPTQSLISAYRALAGNANKSISDIYETFRKLDEFKEL